MSIISLMSWVLTPAIGLPEYLYIFALALTMISMLCTEEDPLVYSGTIAFLGFIVVFGILTTRDMRLESPEIMNDEVLGGLYISMKLLILTASLMVVCHRSQALLSWICTRREVSSHGTTIGGDAS